jgi:hypothetical protein
MPPAAIQRRSAGQQLRRDPAEVRQARRLVWDVLDSWGLDACIDHAMLISSELFFPRCGSISPKVHPGSPSWLPDGSSRRQAGASSVRISAGGRGGHIRAAGRQQ